MTTRTAVCAALVAAVAGGPTGVACADIDIPPAALPAESYFAANPGETVNVFAGGSIFPDAGDGTAFTFNGATVNLETGSESGFFTLDHFMEDVTFNINGGTLTRCKMIGGTGATILNINSGAAERGLWLEGNTACNMAGGSIGVVGGGQAALIVEDFATFSMSDGDIDTFVIFQDDAIATLSGGDIAGALQLNDRAVVTVTGGSSGNNGLMRDPDCVLNVAGGIVGDSFVADRGTVNLSGGGMGGNCAILNGTGGVDPTFNMTGGALGTGFRAYDGTINVSGGLVGDIFRLGRPTGDGSGVTMNLTVKSAMLDGVALDLSTTPSVITTRGGAFLSCVLLDDSLVGFNLNEAFVASEDRFRAAATLTIALGPCAADIDGDGDADPDDINAFVAAFTDGIDGNADVDGDGDEDPDDINAFVDAFTAGC